MATKLGFDIPPQIPPAPNVSLVYFVTCNRAWFPVKIGLSSSRFIRRRMTQLQVSMPYKIDVLFVMEADAVEERMLHEAYGVNRLRGEWFERNKDLDDDLAFMRREYPNWRDWIA